MSRDHEKQLAGDYAASFVKDEMIVGLGTGSTVYYTILKIAERVKEENLRLTFVSTSVRTTELAKSLGLFVHELNDVPYIDLTIDGCDEFDPELNGIKGGGGALLFEKIVAKASRENIWVADRTKEVNQLGAFPLPVEVMQFGSRHTIAKIEEAGLHPVVRKLENGATFITDSGNLTVDLHMEKIKDPARLTTWLNGLPGVVENGLFLDIANRVILPNEDGSIKEIVRGSKNG